MKRLIADFLQNVTPPGRLNGGIRYAYLTFSSSLGQCPADDGISVVHG